MGKWVVKTAADYRAALQAIKQKADMTIKAKTYAGFSEFIGVCLNIMSDAAALAPLDTGALRSSAYCTVNGRTIAHTGEGGALVMVGSPDEFDGLESITVTIGFSSSLAPYAFTQHEHIEFTHKNGEAKFLEKSFDYWVSQLTTIMRNAMDKAGE